MVAAAYGDVNVPKAEVTQDYLMMRTSLKKKEGALRKKNNTECLLCQARLLGALWAFSHLIFIKTHKVGVVTFSHIWGNLA